MFKVIASIHLILVLLPLFQSQALYHVQSSSSLPMQEVLLPANYPVRDNSPPILALTDTSVLVKDHWDTTSLIASIHEESNYSLTYTTKDIDSDKQRICVIAIDQFSNTTKQCRDYVIVAIEDAFLAEYYDERLEETIVNYIEANQINPKQLGLYYRNLTTDEEITIHADTSFKAASSIKFPLGTIIYEYIHQDLISKSDTIIYQKKHNVGGTTIIPRYYRYGDAITVQTLLKYMLVYSDNNATQMLFDRLGAFGKWQDIMTEFFNVPNDTIQVVGNVVTPDYMMKAIDYVNDHDERYEQFIEYLTMSYPKRYLKKYLDKVPIMHKCGFHAGNINDMGIVYGDQPYAIVILTSQIADAEHHIGSLNALIYSYLSFTQQLHDVSMSNISVSSITTSIPTELRDTFFKT